MDNLAVPNLRFEPTGLPSVGLRLKRISFGGRLRRPPNAPLTGRSGGGCRRQTARCTRRAIARR
ncbi:MAG TPA: hypothetical protein GX400_21570 [Chloroflexi bacterium]|nr:hypothetical protein [Chloroflexota bacterium]